MSGSFNSATVTITGGTGSFGETMLRGLLREDVAEIRVFSRDENKQDSLRRLIRDARVKFYLGDVRDKFSVEQVVRGSDFVFHAAALKQVPSCEFFPMQATYTNVNGSANVIEASVRNHVKGVVCLSSDKAVYPINAMGISKALMEKVAQSFARNPQNNDTKIAITRYGNVMLSRGSVIPLFVNQIKKSRAVTITHPRMTRFLMSLDESVDLVKYAFFNSVSGDVFVKKAPACSVETLATALSRIMNLEGEVEFRNIGIRHGEKLFESLLGAKELAKAEDLGEYFRVPLDARSLDYEIYFEEGHNGNSISSAYTSDTTSQLTVDEVVEKLIQLPDFMQMVERQ